MRLGEKGVIYLGYSSPVNQCYLAGSFINEVLVAVGGRDSLCSDFYRDGRLSNISRVQPNDVDGISGGSCKHIGFWSY